MTLLSKLIELRDNLQSGTIDIAAYNAGVKEVVAAHKTSMTEADKAAVFDKLIDYSTGILTEQEETWEDHYDWKTKGPVIYRDDDNTHYEWEHLMTTLFGADFFSFFNPLYSGG